MKLLKVVFSVFALVMGLLFVAHPVQAELTDEARVTIECRDHEVAVQSVEFRLNDATVYVDNAPEIGCAAASGDSKQYPFGTALDINAFQFTYISDGGLPTTMLITPDQFYFHIPVKLVCPSPGGVIGMDLTPPNATDAMMVISDHDVLMWPSSECFQFRGGLYDYVCVTWYCETAFEPVFRITPGCSDECGDPGCPPAEYAGVAWSAACNPVPNIWCRMFWPVGLTSPGCWCYHFDYQLPVELASFTAVSNGENVELSFATASENNNSHFEIWRSTEQYGSFEKVAQLSSRGNSATEQVYSFTDHGVSTGRTYWYYLVDEDFEGHRIEHRDRMVTATIQSSAGLPDDYSLSAYPNPFNPTTTIEFTLPVESLVKVSVYDVTGRLVADLVNTSFEAGRHTATFDASMLTTGLYLARIEAGSFHSSTKLLLIK